jgi:hypothetical protein
MKTSAIICNIILFLFTCFVILTDGISGEAEYIILTILLLLVPVLNTIFFFRSQDKRPNLKILAVIGNVVLIGFACQALIEQHSHPRETGFLLYAILVVLTPILSLAAIFVRKASKA